MPDRLPDVRRNGHANGNGNGYHAPPASRSVAMPDRLPPQNLEAEQGVLGSILLDNSVLDDVITFLAGPDFYRDSHETIYGVMLDLYEAGKPIDVVTLIEELERRGQLKQIGGDAAIEAILDATPHAAHGKYYAQIVKQKAIGRALIETANEILRDGYAQSHTAEELVELAERKVFAIADSSVTDSAARAADVVQGSIDRITSRGTALVGGIMTGFPVLDDMVDGFLPEKFWILAARPSMGKTAMALNLVEAVAMKAQRPVLFCSLEMGRDEIGERLLTARSMVPNYKLRRTDSLRKDEWESLNRVKADWEHAPLFIDDDPERTTLQILAHARRIKARCNDLGLIVVDYLQLLTPPPGNKDGREQVVARFSRDLKKIARALKVTVVACCQLNRDAEKRENHRPRMADLRESGAIEQDADIVAMLHRPEYYDKEDRPGEADLIIVKNRGGPTGDVPLSFIKEMGRFSLLMGPPPPLAAF